MWEPWCRFLFKPKLDESKESDPSKPMEHSYWILCLHWSPDRQASHSYPLRSSFVLFLYILQRICLFILAKMGLIMSFAGKGFPITPVISKVMDKFQEEFLKKNLENPDDFHVAVLDMFASVNKVLPGKHWRVPPYTEIEIFFNEMEKSNLTEEAKKEKVLTFLKKWIQPDKLDKFSLMIGLATPPAAMAAKKAGERVPQLKFMKSVPDVLFVPGATLLTLTAVKLSRIFFLQHEAS
ncbi:uncharacterized protein LOC132645787 [Lycium barbarum]|uniref:uncharacterized protein LOC132645787 n=1 Tax=Lycium barbarum TaxID=112863 RepID=UPI00293F0DC0|nr:uncharacterized protein LOC132645787 [Lycium barbarum]